MYKNIEKQKPILLKEEVEYQNGQVISKTLVQNNNISWKNRVKELLIDYISVVLYLIILFLINIGISFIILDRIPKMNELQSQLTALLLSVIPIIVIFSFLDYKNGTLGKQKAKLKLYYRRRTFGSSLTRNIIKFLPWQLSHIGVIHGVYNEFNLLSIIVIYSGLGIGVILILMSFLRKDKRHLADLIAKTQVQKIS